MVKAAVFIPICLLLRPCNIHGFKFQGGIRPSDSASFKNSPSPKPMTGRELFSTSQLFAPRFSLLQRHYSKIKLRSTALIEGELKKEESLPYGPHVKVGGKVLNVIGFLFIFTSMFSIVLTFPFTAFFWAFSKLFDQKRRRMVDKMVTLWAQIAMGLMSYRAKVEGAENLPNDDEGVLFLPNHTSMLDILTLSAFLPRGFKYVSKIEILNIPFIGWTMQMAGHIPIKRSDPRSQIETVRNTINALKDGNSICMFPEGTRTKTGRIGDFKKGPFSIAAKSGARVVPISICNVTKWYPNHAAVPLRVPNNIVVKIHPPIDPRGLTVKELMDKTFDSIEGGLPNDQKKFPIS